MFESGIFTPARPVSGLATVVRISSAGCIGQKEGATRAHKNVFREVMLDVGRHQRTKGKREVTTLGSDKTVGSLWQMGEYTSVDICSKEELWAGRAQEAATTSLEEEMQGKEHKVTKVEERIWDMKPDGMVMDRGAKACKAVAFQTRRERCGDGEGKGRFRARMRA